MTVYNFQVEGFHTYYAGVLSVLVHNANYPEDVRGMQEQAKPEAEGGALERAYAAPDGGGGITATVNVEGQTVNFGHGGRHLEGTGLDVDAVNQALANEVSTLNMSAGQFYKGQIIVDGINIEYTSYCVSEGIINIGTYYPME